ncbi:MAG: XrtA-associated tyrosine autokinase [Alphaproteobacteria bacterium]|uniref:non-specific protein-tyrosine kinase n=1 Tax=Candidatus Nitrobium versatile TaxID=2884831 RepID=A0A953M1S2_9BACT|nr:XrtA-associated tyrosine autokinase [Candidatus Nitrobium versatile]
MSRIEKALEKAVQLRDSRAESDKKPVFTKERVRERIKESVFDAEESLTVDNPYVITLKDPGSPASEEYRKLKSMIVKITHQEAFLNALMVTSSLSWEGKTLTAMNLAITLAQEYDYTVLLVDADLRRPSLHGYFNIKPEFGLADCLTDEIDLGDALIKTGIGKLSFLPSGKKVSNPVELLSSQRMKELIAEMKMRYPDRYIIIDTPPLLPFAETHAISCMVDGVIFVVKEGKTSLQSIDDSMEILQQSRLLGIVYNGVDTGGSGVRNYHHSYSGINAQSGREA